MSKLVKTFLCASVLALFSFGQAAAQNSEDPFDTIFALQSRSVAAMEAGRKDEAIDLMAQAKAMADRSFPDDPTRYAVTRDYASMLRVVGRRSEAGQLLEETLLGFEATLGDRDPETSKAAATLANFYREMGRFEEAEKFLRIVISMRSEILGASHDDTLGSINDLGVVLRATGRLAEAETHFRRALANARLNPRGEGARDWVSMQNLGSLMVDTGREEEGEALLREALAATRAAHGDRHIDTLSSLNGVASALAKRGENAEAERLFRKVLEGRRALLGDHDPATLTAMNNLGFALESLGRRKEAETLYREALRTGVSVLGDAHPQTLTQKNNLGLLLEKTARWSEAEPLLRDVLAYKRQQFGGGHADTIGGAHTLAALLMKAGRTAEAVDIYSESAAGALTWRRIQIRDSVYDWQRRYFANDASHFDDFVFSAALIDGSVKARRLAADIALSWKGAEGEEDALVARFIADVTDPQTEVLGRELATRRGNLAHALNSGAPDVDSRIADVQNARELLRRRLNASVGPERMVGFSFADVQDALGPDGALLEFRAFTPFDFKEGTFQNWRLLGVLIQSQGDPIIADLGPLLGHWSEHFRRRRFR